MGDIEVDRQITSDSFVWFVKDFVNYKLEDEILVAKGEFKANGGSQRLEMMLRKDKSYLNYKIKITNNGRSSDKGKVTVAILTPNLNKFHEYSAVIDVNQESEINFLLENLIENNSVLFYGRHLLLNGTVSFPTCAHTTPVEKPSLLKEIPSLRQISSTLLESGTFHDTTIEVNHRKFFCHKAIMASRSEYFRLWFKGSKGITKIMILDTEPSIFEVVLIYIYTGEAKITEDNVLQIFDASKKFSLKHLKDICAEKLMSYFSFQNVLKMLDASAAYELENLRNLALFFIMAFAEDIQIISKVKSQNSVEELEADKDQIAGGKSVTNVPQKAAAVNQRVNLNESPTSLEGKPYLPAADMWYVEDCRVIFRITWMFNIHEKDEKKRSKHFTDDKSSSTFELFWSLSELKTYTNIKKECHFGLSLLAKLSSCDSFNIRYNICFADKNEGSKSMVFEDSLVLAPTSRSCRISLLRVKLEDIPISDGGNVSLKCFIMSGYSFCHEFKQFSSGEDTLISDISSLKRDKYFQDLEIRFGEGKKISCHKAIVLSLCPFLKKRVKQTLGKSIIDLGAKEIPHFETFLSFLYGNDEASQLMSNLDNEMYNSLAWKLLPSAHAFQMNDLRKACEEILVSKLDLENALNAYDFSKKYDLLKLEEATIKFISNHFSVIIRNNRSHELFKDSQFLRVILKQP